MIRFEAESGPSDYELPRRSHEQLRRAGRAAGCLAVSAAGILAVATITNFADPNSDANRMQADRAAMCARIEYPAVEACMTDGYTLPELIAMANPWDAVGRP